MMLLLPQGLGSLEAVGQDIAIRGNPELTSLSGMTGSLRTVGTYRGSDIFIEDNPKLSDLGGLEAGGVAVYGSATVQRNSASLSEASVNALKSKIQAVPITVETLMNGLPSGVAQPSSG
jgi:hypothetical protein